MLGLIVDLDPMFVVNPAVFLDPLTEFRCDDSIRVAQECLSVPFKMIVQALI